MSPDEQRAYIAVLAAEAKELRARAHTILNADRNIKSVVKASAYDTASKVLDERVAVLTRDLEGRK